MSRVGRHVEEGDGHVLHECNLAAGHVEALLFSLGKVRSVVNVQFGIVDERVIDVVVLGACRFFLTTRSDSRRGYFGVSQPTFLRLGFAWSSWVSSPSLSLMSGLGGGGVGCRWPEALARAEISTSYFSGPPSLMSRRTVVSGCGGGGGGGGVGERERGRDCFEDFGFSPVPAVEAGLESAADAECLILFEGGGLTSLLMSRAGVRPPLLEGGPTELSRLLSSITSLRPEIAELWLVGGASAGEIA